MDNLYMGTCPCIVQHCCGDAGSVGIWPGSREVSLCLFLLLQSSRAYRSGSACPYPVLTGFFSSQAFPQRFLMFSGGARLVLCPLSFIFHPSPPPPTPVSDYGYFPRFLDACTAILWLYDMYISAIHHNIHTLPAACLPV